MGKRRAHGEGSIRQRKDGSWEARYTDPVSGKRASLYAETQRAARDALRRALQRIDAGAPAQDSKERLSDFLQRWLDELVKPKRAHKTYTSYAERVRLDIAPYLGGITLPALTPRRVQSWIAELLTEVDATGKVKRSPRTVEYAHSILRGALSIAVKWGLVQRNVASLAEAPRVTRKPMHPLTVDEAQTLIKHVGGTRWEGFYRVALGLGLRMGELINLTWADVDYQGARLSVRRSKTHSGVRRINLPAFIVGALRAHQERQRLECEAMPAGWNAAGLVFPSEAGTRLWEGNLRGTFKRHLKAAGVRAIRFHDLRHTCASYLLNQGVPVKQVSEILGHSQTSTTVEVYWHILNETQRGALEQAEGLAG